MILNSIEKHCNTVICAYLFYRGVSYSDKQYQGLCSKNAVNLYPFFRPRLWRHRWRPYNALLHPPIHPYRRGPVAASRRPVAGFSRVCPNAGPLAAPYVFCGPLWRLRAYAGPRGWHRGGPVAAPWRHGGRLPGGPGATLRRPRAAHADRLAAHGAVLPGKWEERAKKGQK